MGQITIGSCFAGVGGFELGLERGISNSKTVWQIEQNKYCQGILKKHWPDATIYDDIREIDYDKIQTVDIICGGFPCQDISAAGKGKGIEHGDRSGLWRQMHRLINHLQPRVAVLENVPALLWKNRGMHIVMHDLASIGYDAEWCTISARQFGAPHLRKRVFVVAYTNQIRPRQTWQRLSDQIDRNGEQLCAISQKVQTKSEHPNNKHSQEQPTNTMSMGTKSMFKRRCSPVKRIQQANHQNYWQRFPTQPPLRRRDDGLPDRLARLRALGNAIVPQCSEYIGRCIWQSGLLD